MTELMRIAGSQSIRRTTSMLTSASNPESETMGHRSAGADLSRGQRITSYGALSVPFPANWEHR